jgi:seryl-tRNA synthetase
LEKEIADMKAQVESASAISASCNERQAVIDADITSVMSIIPNLLDDRVPEGDSDADNPIVFSWGADLRKIGAEGTFLWHDEIARSINGLDIDAAAGLSGARFSVLVGPVARLERALMQFFLDFHTSQGYTEVSVPYIVSR